MRKLLFVLVLLFAAPLAHAQKFISSSGGVLAVDCLTGTTSFKTTVFEAITSVSIVNAVPGETISIIFQQDATGHSVTFGGNVAGTPSVSSTANAVTVITLNYDSRANTWNQENSGGGSLNINGSPVSSPNLNGTTPSADSGFVAATMKVSGSNAIAEVPNTLDAIANPGAVKSFALGANVPLNFTAPGVFTNTQMNPQILSIINSCNPTDYFGGQSAGGTPGYATSALLGCAAQNSSSAMLEVDGVLGIAEGFSSKAAVGVTGYGVCKVTSCWIWGGNVNSWDGGFAASQMYGLEVDTFLSNAGSVGQNVRLWGDFNGTQPSGTATSSGNMPAILVAQPSSGKWTGGYAVDTGATLTGVFYPYGNAVDIGSISTGSSKQSQAIIFRATNAAATQIQIQALSSFDPAGNPEFVILQNLSSSITAPIVISAVESGGTTFLMSGCSATSAIGGSSAGSYLSGTTGTCTVTLTLQSLQANNGWACDSHDLTTPADVQNQTATTTTTATVSGTTVSGDKIVFKCTAF